MRAMWVFAFLLFAFVCHSVAMSPLVDEAAGPEEMQPPPTPPESGSATLPPTNSPKVEDDYLGPEQCLEQKYTRMSCSHVFCRPWERCIENQCVCKLPYQCPKVNQTAVCGRDSRNYMSYCQTMAISCRLRRPFMSHFGSNCQSPQQKFLVEMEMGVVKMSLPGNTVKVLVCDKLWNMAAANVACREQLKELGALSATSVFYKDLEPVVGLFPQSCVSVRCRGYENSLAECDIYDQVDDLALDLESKVAKATCYNQTEGQQCDFKCVSVTGKCVSLEQTCDGVDDCGDNSDEMCCKKCRGDAFRCRTGVCIPRESVGDEVRDCLDGQDEVPPPDNHSSRRDQTSSTLRITQEHNSPRHVTIQNRLSTEYREESCGIPKQMEDDDVEKTRVKRVVGGIPAKPTQIQWQVAIEERRKIDCGGAYIGGCWVLTAAHCVSQDPRFFAVKISLWRKIKAQDTTDIVPVKAIHVHPRYNPSTYENDIALMELEKLPGTDQCFIDNPAVTAVCVPWSTELFRANHSCSISGWGRNKAGKGAEVLLWANVSLIPDCQSFYKDRFKPGMMCAGDLDGSVDSCQGDSGGPLVCQDDLGVSYLWGIVSWGERCGAANFPGVYTQVAHYFEWIRLHTGWPAVSKYNI